MTTSSIAALRCAENVSTALQIPMDDQQLEVAAINIQAGWDLMEAKAEADANAKEKASGHCCRCGRVRGGP